jgi:hypothetical protein
MLFCFLYFHDHKYNFELIGLFSEMQICPLSRGHRLLTMASAQPSQQSPAGSSC